MGLAMVVDYNQLLQQCTNGVHPVVMHGIISQESSFNPYAIGVVKGRLSRQPQNLSEAVAAVKALSAAKKNYSMGLAQVNKRHMKRFGFTPETIFEPCANVKAGATIFKECHQWAKSKLGSKPESYGAALSCYYSGNFTTGFKRYGNDKLPYVIAVSLRMKTYGNRPNVIGEGIKLSPKVFKVAGNPILTLPKPKQVNVYAGSVQQPKPVMTDKQNINYQALTSAYVEVPLNHSSGKSAPVESRVTLQAELTPPFLLGNRVNQTQQTEKKEEVRKSKLLF